MNSRRVDPVQDYWQDAWQRSILMLDVLRQRGNIYREHNAETVPNVLDFDAELVRDGRTLEQPVNYGLVRIVPPKGVKIDAAKRPFIVVDPRAGHGPGIGGMKKESEIGQVLGRSEGATRVLIHRSLQAVARSIGRSRDTRKGQAAERRRAAN
jgi:hypothetical protein